MNKLYQCNLQEKTKQQLVAKVHENLFWYCVRFISTSSLLAGKSLQLLYNYDSFMGQSVWAIRIHRTQANSSVLLKEVLVCAWLACRGEPHRYSGPDTGNVLTWSTVYSPNRSVSHRDMDQKLKPKPPLTHGGTHTFHTHTQLQTYKFRYTRQVHRHTII